MRRWSWYKWLKWNTHLAPFLWSLIPMTTEAAEGQKMDKSIKDKESWGKASTKHTGESRKSETWWSRWDGCRRSKSRNHVPKEETSCARLQKSSGAGNTAVWKWGLAGAKTGQAQGQLPRNHRGWPSAAAWLDQDSSRTTAREPEGLVLNSSLASTGQAQGEPPQNLWGCSQCQPGPLRP